MPSWRIGSLVDFSFQEYAVAVEFEKFSLWFGKAADVDDAIRNDAHFLHGFLVSHRSDVGVVHHCCNFIR